MRIKLGLYNFWPKWNNIYVIFKGSALEMDAYNNAHFPYIFGLFIPCK